MNNLDENTTITVPKGTLLVLFEYLSRSYDSWRRSAPSSDDTTFVLQKPDAVERMAIWRLEGEIEHTLPEIFSKDYAELLEAWKQRLTSS